MAEESPESETPKSDVNAEAEAKAPVILESQIETAMRSRVPHFKEQADSLTFEGVRRLLEKDLGLEEFALDVHKRFIKQCLLKCLEGVGDDDDTPKISGEAGHKGASTKETEGSTEGSQSKKDVKGCCTEDEEKMEDSPVLGLLKEQKTAELETKGDKDNEEKVVPSETLIKKGIRKRASYIRANTEKVTMAGLRRLLEEDLKLEKFALDPYKKLISQQLDEVLNSSEVSKPTNNAKKIMRKKPDTKATKKVSSEEEDSTSDKVDKESDEEDEVKPRKKLVPKAKKLSPIKHKKRKGSPEGKNLSSKKRVKPAKAALEDNSDEEVSGKDSDEDQSHSSLEKPTKHKKEVSTPVYGKRVEHLKSVIKASGMSVPPSIYKKVKQAPENKREAQLIKELEEILSREGLSSNPSEKEIKEVRKKKERARELEGIDLSNIVSSSRRRSVTSFAPPPKPKIPVETNGNDTEGSDDDNEDEGDDNEDEGNDNEEDEEEDSSDVDESQSDEFNADEDNSD